MFSRKPSTCCGWNSICFGRWGMVKVSPRGQVRKMWSEKVVWTKLPVMARLVCFGHMTGRPDQYARARSRSCSTSVGMAGGLKGGRERGKGGGMGGAGGEGGKAGGRGEGWRQTAE